MPHTRVPAAAGKKLSAARAELVAERVRDFVMYCSPKPGTAGAREYSVGPVTVTNAEHEAYTVVSGAGWDGGGGRGAWVENPFVVL